MPKVELLTCNECNESRMAAEGTRCIMTLGCIGKMRKYHKVNQEVTWWQEELFDVDPYTNRAHDPT